MVTDTPPYPLRTAVFLNKLMSNSKRNRLLVVKNELKIVIEWMKKRALGSILTASFFCPFH